MYIYCLYQLYRRRVKEGIVLDWNELVVPSASLEIEAIKQLLRIID
jgi:hypothetical protein